MQIAFTISSLGVPQLLFISFSIPKRQWPVEPAWEALSHGLFDPVDRVDSDIFEIVRGCFMFIWTLTYF